MASLAHTPAWCAAGTTTTSSSSGSFAIGSPTRLRPGPYRRRVADTLPGLGGPGPTTSRRGAVYADADRASPRSPRAGSVGVWPRSSRPSPISTGRRLPAAAGAAAAGLSALLGPPAEAGEVPIEDTAPPEPVEVAPLATASPPPDLLSGPDPRPEPEPLSARAPTRAGTPVGPERERESRHVPRRRRCASCGTTSSGRCSTGWPTPWPSTSARTSTRAPARSLTSSCSHRPWTGIGPARTYALFDALRVDLEAGGSPTEFVAAGVPGCGRGHGR